MTSFSIFTFCVSVLLMCQTDMFALGVERKPLLLLYGCSYSDTCNGNINHQWCFQRSTKINSDHFNITSVSGATAGLYDCCSSGILNMNTQDCCAALESGGQPTVSFNVTVRARPELSCEPSNCSIVIRPNDTSLSLKGVLRPAVKGFEIQQAQGLWKYDNGGDISSNGTLPQHTNINVTIVGETSETLLLNGPGLSILNGTEFSFEIVFSHGDSICNTNDQPNTKITYTVVVVDPTSTTSPPPTTSILSISTVPNSSNIVPADSSPSDVFWVAIPAVLVPIVLLILLLVACGCYCHCKKKSKDEPTDHEETKTISDPLVYKRECYIRVEPTLRMECSASPPTASLSSCESGSKEDINESEEISSLHFEGNLEDVPSEGV